MVEVTRQRLVSRFSPAAWDEAAARFASHSYLKLPGFLEPSLLALVLDHLDRTPFYDRVHDGIGIEHCALPGAVTGALELLMNDPALRSMIAALTGCGPIGCFEGRVYRLHPREGHYDSWHSDVGEDRLVALSINLGRDPFEGGRLQIRRADALEMLAEVDNPVAGDAVIFRVHPTLRHRVGPVTGSVPRTAYAGWFRATPDFRELLARHVERHSLSGADAVSD